MNSDEKEAMLNVLVVVLRPLVAHATTGSYQHGYSETVSLLAAADVSIEAYKTITGEDVQTADVGTLSDQASFDDLTGQLAVVDYLLSTERLDEALAVLHGRVRAICDKLRPQDS